MAYYLRALCARSSLPSSDALVAAAGLGGINARLVTSDRADDASLPWVRLVFGLPGGGEIEFEAASADVRPDLFEEELDEFRAFVDDADADAADVDRVQEHLSSTRVVVAIEIPRSEREAETALAFAHAALPLFVTRAGALTQADGEGIYDEHGNLLVELD